MANFYTDIYWQLSNHCTAECSYCPIRFREGSYPEESWDYIKIVNLLTNHYNNNLQRIIKWNFDGGEPLDLHNIVRILNTAKANTNHITLNTNGGKLWIDWWAIEPVVDNLILTYHYWQNPKLINYIIDLFKNKNKSLTIKIPIRPNFFDIDIQRCETLEKEKQIAVTKILLFTGEYMNGTRYFYTQDQLEKITDSTIPNLSILKNINVDLKNLTDTNLSYLGKYCNAGIERLYISYLGFVNGSMCRNITLGNIWLENWKPPMQPQICGMMNCTDPNDRQITKFTSETQN